MSAGATSATRYGPGMPDDVVDLLVDLVRIPSLNPEGHPGADCAHTGEERIARYVGDFLSGLGAEVDYEEVAPLRPNVVGRFPTRREPTARVLFAPHLDTVGVAGMRVPPFAGEIDGGRLYGRGACDTKGSMAAMLWALREWRASAPDPSTEITFVGLMGEETGQPGSIDFGARHPGAYDFAVVGEPTEGRIVHAHKGCSWIDLAVPGRAAHASTPHLGSNAIVAAARLVLALETSFRASLEERFADPLLGVPTLNVGEIRGGTRPNIVPDRALMTIDLRTTPALEQADPVRVVNAFLDQIENLTGRVHVYAQPAARSLHTPADHPFVRRLAEATGALLDTAPWFCDAAHLAAAGIPAVAAGPGSIAQAHTEDEWIALDALEDGVAFYRRFLEALA